MKILFIVKFTSFTLIKIGIKFIKYSTLFFRNVI